MATIQRDVLHWVNQCEINEVFTAEEVAKDLDLDLTQAASALANQLRNYTGMPYERVSRGTYRRIIPVGKVSIVRANDGKVPTAISGADQHHGPTPDIKFVGRSQAGDVLVLVDGIVGKVVPV